MNSSCHNNKLNQINKNKQNCSPRYGQLIKEINDIQILPSNNENVIKCQSPYQLNRPDIIINSYIIYM